MPRKTPQELLEAKRQRAEERREDEERLRLEGARVEAERQAEEQRVVQRMSDERELFERNAELTSYTDGIYDEVSKLSNKRPTDPVSDRMVERANRAIRSARELLVDENDPFLDEIEEFVPAGDQIEARDVVLTLRQVKDVLERMRKRHREDWRFW